jgi:protein-S-isoprenylcysteine O-methyltransferase Ste14
MKRLTAILGSIVFLVLAPGTVAILVPWWIGHWHVEPPLLHLVLLRWIGAMAMVAGAAALLDSFARFALQGAGTPAPVFPTERLVVSGLYRYVRNPMYIAVAALIFGQGLFFGDLRILLYGAAVCLAFHIFVIAYEEPTLLKIYGPQYEEFCAHVPRWTPRLKAWGGPSVR